MSDQCKNCTVRGDWTECQVTECFHHKNWAWLQLQQERDQLKAQNAELIIALNRIDLWNDFSPSERCDLGSWGERDHYRKVAQFARDKSPAVCLAEIQAKAIEEFVDKLIGDDTDSVSINIRTFKHEYLEELRQKAAISDKGEDDE